MRDVCCVGVGMSKWGEVWERSLRQLFVDAATAAIKDSGVDHLDSLHVGCMSGGMFIGQEHIGALCADYLGMRGLPATHVESACASGGIAVRQGYIEVAAGVADIVMAAGVEKMTDCSGDDATAALAGAADKEYEVFHGATFPGLYAMMAHAHMHKYGTTPEMLATVSSKNHENGSMNPVAQYPFKVSVDQVLSSVMIADPLHILDCSPITDGASAIILTTEEIAKKLGKPYTKITGSGLATDAIQLADRTDLASIPSAALALERALKMAGKKLSDIDFAELHDCFTIAEIIIMEEIGLYERGKAGPAVLAGETRLDGKFPINTSGGLKAKGHPVGATGVAQMVELHKQLLGLAENGRQLKTSPKVGMAQNMGGTGASSAVHIMEVA
ncbi:MAG TPA: thiolase domain-containing protein [candidate division Zixibacteria bacterium]|nr:thiolase domain-containing protein [candidate division Zixibacteria bacterium]